MNEAEIVVGAWQAFMVLGGGLAVGLGVAATWLRIRAMNADQAKRDTDAEVRLREIEMGLKSCQREIEVMREKRAERDEKMFGVLDEIKQSIADNGKTVAAKFATLETEIKHLQKGH